MLKLWYMLDRHVFVPLSLDPTEAWQQVMAEFDDEGGTCGMLCGNYGGKHIKEVLHAPMRVKRNEFAERARLWLIATTQKYVQETEYYGA